MSKRAVWLTAVIFLGLSVLSVLYALAKPNRIPFDQVTWLSASSDADFAQRNRMIDDVQLRIDDGAMPDQESVRKILGPPNSTDDASHCWYYFLGSPGGTVSNRRLEIAFDQNDRLISRRIVVD